MASYATLDSQWRAIPPTSVTPGYSEFAATIEKSAQDDRAYRLIRLNNGLEAILVHDKDADTSAAAMDIAVGHLNDPDDMPGLAHFCEHMLFLGTKQFPKENGYNEYISAHGGHTNAYTGSSNTNYYFSVSSTSTPPSSGTSTPLVNGTHGSIPRKSPLPQALEMFASFFHSPLFTESGTARELNAVDSEHKKNSQSDRWRLYQLAKGLSGNIHGKGGAIRRHPWAKFGTGHRGTLSAYGRSVAHRVAKANGTANANGNTDFGTDLVGIADSSDPLPPLSSESDADGGRVGRETRQRLVAWWQTEYCAGRMKLAILGRESLDELTHMAAALFSPIVNHSQDPSPMITESPLGSNEQGTIIETKTVMDFRALDISFHLPWQSPFYRSKPASFLGHLVGHEGPGSIHSYLKDKGWITGVSAGVTAQGRGFSKFGIMVVLTKEGFENYTAILATVYKYLSLLRMSPLEQFHHDEIRAIAEIQFRFKEKKRADDYVSSLAETMGKPYLREHILNGATRVWDWDEGKVREILDSFTPQRSRVMLMAKEFKDDSDWKHETWYGTEYRVRKIDQNLIKEHGQAQQPNDIPELFLPGPNAFIPTDLEVVKQEVAVPAKRPRHILETPLSALWYKKDDQFWVPKGSFNAYVMTPLAHMTPRHALKSQMYTELVNDALTEYSYDASLAGLGYSFGSYDRGIFVGSSGYNEKIPILLKTLLEKMKNIKIDPARFRVIKEDLKLEFENFYLSEPYMISDYWTSYLLTQQTWTPREKLAELESVTVEEVQAHIGQLLSRVYIETLAHGNLREDEAIRLLTLTEKTLGSRPVTPSEKLTERALILPQGSNYVYSTEVPNSNELNSSLSYYCHVGNVAERELRALNSLLLHIMREPTFDELRTKQQLGYIVFVTRWESRGAFGLRFLLQSERGPIYLESRVDAFLHAYKDQLAATSPEEFEKQKEGLISKKLEKLENLYGETNRFWSHITSGYCDFLQHEDDVEVLRNTTLTDLVKFFNTFVHPDSLQRRKLSVHLRSQIMPSTPAPRFSVAASEAFLIQLQSHGVPVEEAQYRALSSAEPPIEAVETFWTESLAKTPGLESATKEHLLRAIEDLARTHPTGGAQPVGNGKVELRPGTNVIDDIARFKASLPLGPAAVPVKDSLELMASK